MAKFYKSRYTAAQQDALLDIVEQGGSGGEGGGDGLEYVAFNVEADLATYGEILGLFAYLVKFPTKIETISIMVMSGETVNDAIAFALDTEAVVDFMGSRKSIKDHALSFGGDISLLPRMTKEQFYTL